MKRDRMIEQQISKRLKSWKKEFKTNRWLINDRFLLSHWTLFFANEKDKIVSVGDLKTNRLLTIEVIRTNIDGKEREDFEITDGECYDFFIKEAKKAKKFKTHYSEINFDNIKLIFTENSFTLEIVYE
jgi:hypothetical protein